MIPQGQAAMAAPPAHRASPQVARLGMWVFLATELMLFGPLFLGYVYGRTHFPEAFAAASRRTDFWLGTINTAILLSSSLAVALAVELRQRGRERAPAAWLLLAASCGVAFLVIKGSEYAHEIGEHLFPGPSFHFAPAAAHGAELFFFLYFAMTGLHALHLAIGVAGTLLFALGVALRLAPLQPPHRLEAFGLYWHFVDSVWIFLYPILYLVGRAAGQG